MKPIPSRFRPFPGLSNPHVQTIAGSLLRGFAPRLPSRDRMVPLSDGDAIVLHESLPDAWRPGGATAVLLHGLGGSHQSSYVRRVSNRLIERGMRIIRVDLRGSGSGERHARKIYNGACSHDVRVVLEHLAREEEPGPTVLVGFSLGGNIALKLAGEAADDPVPGLIAVATLAPPIDMMRCSALISQPSNRFYDWHFVDTLVRLVRRQQRHFPEIPKSVFPKKMVLKEFDDLYTAPQGGFRDSEDYYQRASSAALVSNVQVPTLLLTSRDDPFIAVEPFEALPKREPLHVEILPYGGHLGFLGWSGDGGIRWAERRLSEWVLAAAAKALPRATPSLHVPRSQSASESRANPHSMEGDSSAA